MIGNRLAAGGAPRVGVRRELTIIYGVAALVFVVVAVGALFASRAVARANALHEAERITTRLADRVIGPLLITAMRGDPADWAALEGAVATRMGDGYLIEVSVWGADGKIIYADKDDQIGRQVPPPPEVTAAIQAGAVSSDFEDQPDVGQPLADSADDGGDGFVEVYVPFDLPDGRTLAFEAYYDPAGVQSVADSILWYLIPLVLIPLIVLQLTQVPIAASLANRVRRHEAERARMLELTLSVSERERIQIAADLHDGPIQDLAGIGFALDAVAPTVPTNSASLMGGAQRALRRAIESLRWLIFDVYPPDLTGPALPHTIETLVAPLRSRGIEVTVDVEPLPDLNRDVLTALYRVAREALANVAEHAHATVVDVTLGTRPASGPESNPTVQLTITDDGVGFADGAGDRRAEGHFGLQLLKDRVESLGGSWAMGHGPQGGAEVEVTLPLIEATH